MQILPTLLISFISILLLSCVLFYDTMRKLEKISKSSYDPLLFLYYFGQFQISIQSNSLFESLVTLNYLYYNLDIYSEDTKLAQELLNEIGLFTLNQDGYLDQSTTIAIRGFQIIYDLYPDGILHTETLNKIKEISMGEKGGFPNFKNKIEGEITEYNKESENHPNCESQNRCNEIIYYNQCDKRWKDLDYFIWEEQTNLCKNGSLPVSLAMIVSTLSDRNVTPIETLNAINEYGLYNKSYYVMESFMKFIANKFNLNYEGEFDCSQRDFYEAISKEKNSDSILIAEMFPNFSKDEGKKFVLVSSKELKNLFIHDSNFSNGKNISEVMINFIDHCYESYVFSRKNQNLK